MRDERRIEASPFPFPLKGGGCSQRETERIADRYLHFCCGRPAILLYSNDEGALSYATMVPGPILYTKTLILRCTIEGIHIINVRIRSITLSMLLTLAVALNWLTGIKRVPWIYEVLVSILYELTVLTWAWGWFCGIGVDYLQVKGINNSPVQRLLCIIYQSSASSHFRCHPAHDTYIICLMLLSETAQYRSCALMSLGYKLRDRGLRNNAYFEAIHQYDDRKSNIETGVGIYSVYR